MRKTEKTGPKVVKIAAKTLPSPAASKTAKPLAGSALSQFNTTKQSSTAAATKASKALQDGRTSPATKGIAASVLTQAPTKKPAKKP